MRTAYYQHDWIEVSCWISLIISWLINRSLGRPSWGTALVLSQLFFVSARCAWRDIAAGVWLKKRDLNVARGKANLLFYLAHVFFLLAFTPVCVFLVLCEPSLPVGVFIHYGAVCALFMLCSGMLFYLSLYHARRGRTKIWFHSQVHCDRQRNIWPPSIPSSSQTDVLELFFLFLVFCPVALIAASVSFGAAQMVIALLGAQGESHWSVLLVYVVLGFGPVLTVLALRPVILSSIRKRYFVHLEPGEAEEKMYR